MFLLVLIIMLLSQNVILSQFLDYGEIDSLRINQKYNLLLNANNDFSILNRSLIIKNAYGLSLETDYFNNAVNDFKSLNSFEMNRIKNEINRSLLVFRKEHNKYHLGTVSDVLGYVNAAAAAGLASYHLYKYRKKYGIK